MIKIQVRYDFDFIQGQYQVPSIERVTRKEKQLCEVDEMVRDDFSEDWNISFQKTWKEVLVNIVEKDFVLFSSNSDEKYVVTEWKSQISAEVTEIWRQLNRPKKFEFLYEEDEDSFSVWFDGNLCQSEGGFSLSP